MATKLLFIYSFIFQIFLPCKYKMLMESLQNWNCYVVTRYILTIQSFNIRILKNVCTKALVSFSESQNLFFYYAKIKAISIQYTLNDCHGSCLSWGVHSLREALDQILTFSSSFFFSLQIEIKLKKTAAVQWEKLQGEGTISNVKHFTPSQYWKAHRIMLSSSLTFVRVGQFIVIILHLISS